MTNREQMRLIEERVQIPQPPVVEALCEICSDLDVFDRHVVSTGSPYSRPCAQRDVLMQDLTLRHLSMNPCGERTTRTVLKTAEEAARAGVQVEICEDAAA